MPTIRNKLNHRINIHLKSGKNIDLLSRGTAVISKEDLNSSQLQTLFAKEKVIISSKEEKPKNETKYINIVKKEPEVSGTEDTSESVVDEPIEKSEEQPQEPSEEQTQELSEDVPEELPEKPEPKKGPRRKSK